jgi:hypothetical protein
MALIEKTQNQQVALTCVSALGNYIPKGKYYLCYGIAKHCFVAIDPDSLIPAASHPKYYQNAGFMRRICEILKTITVEDAYYEVLMVVLDRITAMSKCRDHNNKQ